MLKKAVSRISHLLSRCLMPFAAILAWYQLLASHIMSQFSSKTVSSVNIFSAHCNCKSDRLSLCYLISAMNIFYLTYVLRCLMPKRITLRVLQTSWRQKLLEATHNDCTSLVLVTPICKRVFISCHLHAHHSTTPVMSVQINAAPFQGVTWVHTSEISEWGLGLLLGVGTVL